MSSALKDFLAYMASEKGLAGNTLLAYEADLEDFQRFCIVKKIDSLRPDIRHLRSYLAHLRTRELSDRSIARRASSLRQFFRFLVREGLNEEDPAELLTVIRKGRRLPKHLSEEEVLKLLEAAPGRSSGEIRDRAMLEVWYATGCRVSELANLQADAVDWEEGLVKVQGKGGRERLVPLTSESLIWGKRYGEIRHEWLRLTNLKEPEVFFLSRRGTKLTRQAIWKIVKHYAKEAGITRNVWPHMIRHTFATHVLRGGADLRAVQELLGHRSIATTEIYTHLDPENLKIMQHKYHPRG